MVRLAEDPALARRVGEAALERARRFTWEAFVDGFDDAVDRMAAQEREIRQA